MFSSLLPYRNSKRLREFDKIEISNKVAEVTVNNKAENSEDFCLDFVQEFWPPYYECTGIITTHASNTETLSGIFLTRYRTGRANVRGPRYPDDTRINEVWKYYVY